MNMVDENNNNIEEEIILDEEVVGEENLKNKVGSLRKKLKSKEEEAKQNLDGWQRARAELINKEKQLASEKIEIIKYSNQSLIEEILGTLDNYFLAKKNKEAWEKVDSNWRSGIEYIFQNLEKVLFDRGLTLVKCEQNSEYDVNTMESVGEVSTTEQKDEGKVAEIISPGYKLGDKLIRATKVKLWKKTN